MSALLQAIIQRRWRQAKLLVEVGVDLNRKGADGRTPLMELCHVNNDDISTALTKLLIENGANMGIRDNEGKTVLSHACIARKRELVVLLTKFVDYDLNSTDSDGNTALNHAIISGDEFVVKVLVQKIKNYGLSVDTLNYKGETPLVNALKARKNKIAEILINEGKASLQVQDNETGKTASEMRKEILRKKKPYTIPSAFLRESGNTGATKDGKEKQKKVKSANMTRIVLPQVVAPNTRPVTAPERIKVPTFFQPCTPVRNNLAILFSMYNQQASELYRKGYKPVKYVHVEPVIEVDACSEITFGTEDDTFPQSTIKSKVSFAQVNEINSKLKGLHKASSTKRKVVNMLGNRGLLGSTDSEESLVFGRLSATGKTSKIVNRMVKSPAVKAFTSAPREMAESLSKK